MARTTRSSAQAATSESSISPKAQPPAQKKRKRTSVAPDEEPPQKHIKTETVEPDDTPFGSAGDRPIRQLDAEKILNVLELIDTQGLLDREFPLPSNNDTSYSLRALLKDAGQHALWVLRSAVQHLFPISSHPRSKISPPAAQQRRFCELALSLLDQASRFTLQIPDDITSLLPNSSAKSSAAFEQRRYALVQHLPSGDIWSSLSSSSDLKGLYTAKADLVSVLPSSISASSSTPIPTLGSYCPIPFPEKFPAPVGADGRRNSIPRGSFLSYGAFTTFAPAWDQDGSEANCREMAEVYWLRTQRRKSRQEKMKKEELKESTATEDGAFSQDREPSEQKLEAMNIDPNLDQSRPHLSDSDAALLTELLPPDQIETVKSALESLEQEEMVQVLLEKNGRALQRLDELQALRLQSSQANVEEGSEEWDTAHAILDSLTLLASLRPRASSSLVSDPSPLTPTPSALHRLQRTLPLRTSFGAENGWWGTLSTTKQNALRDDITVSVTVPEKKEPPVDLALPPGGTPGYSIPNGITRSTPSYYSNQQSYRNEGSGGYYSSTTYQTPQQYGTQAYGATSAGYNGWFNSTVSTPQGYGSYQGAYQAPQTGYTNGTSTYFGSVAASATPTRGSSGAVANTVHTPQPNQQQWAQTAPVIPSHLRK